ncbi:hypothetical protein BS50DRAFT_264516 [Corynespora cassiicola Philippines]|uniref:Uncharacterized protein n=1 Tax=Corynespora cassiicola Philippines TaxID=1448308 RepID=A0A2T2NYV4_CORCC|nr:hypothetical protein BS50DRAFT_264516 [Corynespora cassiicola Philippines]
MPREGFILDWGMRGALRSLLVHVVRRKEGGRHVSTVRPSVCSSIYLPMRWYRYIRTLMVFSQSVSQSACSAGDKCVRWMEARTPVFQRAQPRCSFRNAGQAFGRRDARTHGVHGAGKARDAVPRGLRTATMDSGVCVVSAAGREGGGTRQSRTVGRGIEV